MRAKTKKRSRPYGALIEPLESRVLYSADPFGLGIDTSEPTDLATDNLPDSWQQQTTATEIFIVDEYTPNYQALVNEIATRTNTDDLQSVRIYTISHNQSLADVSDILSAHNNVNSLHIITHGFDASLRIGSTVLDHSTIEDFESDLQTWGKSLTESGDVLFYGCNLAETDDGQKLAQKIANLTGADVAASKDITGHDSLGGNWALEYASGDIAPESLILSDGIEAWESVLAPITVTTEDDKVDSPDLSSTTSLYNFPGPDGKISLREAIIAANANADLDTIILPAGNYDLNKDATPLGITDDQYIGDLDVWNSILLQGDGMGTTTIDAKNLDRVFSFSGGTSTIENVKIQNGETIEFGAGFLVKDTTLTLNFIDLHNNESLDERGGGIYIDGSTATVNINDSIIRKNKAGVDLSFDKAGGGIHNWAGTVNISRTELTENRGNYGAAIFNHGLLNIKDSWFHINEANDRGGAIHNEGTANIDRTLFQTNKANGGGAISNTGYTLIENSTFSANEANNHGGAILSTTDGSGASGITDIFGSTIAYNKAAAFGAIDLDSGTVNLQNSIIDQSDTNSGVDINGSVTSLGHNLSNTTIPNALDTDYENTTPGIESSLSDQGGFSEVYALDNNSLAINRASFNDPDSYTSEQDGTGAARNELPDIGAFEFRQTTERGELFWTDTTEKTIYRGDTEGHQSEKVLSSLGLPPLDIEIDLAHGRIFWLEVNYLTSLSNLFSAKLDGTDVQTLETDLNSATGLALDSENQTIFVTTNSTLTNGAVDNTIETYKYDGTAVLPALIEGNLSDTPPEKMETPTDVEYDPIADTVIWTDSGESNGGIQSITGSSPVTTVISLPDSDTGRPTGLSLTPDGTRIYWSDGSRIIQTSDVDGSNPDLISIPDSGFGPYIVGLQYHEESDVIYAIDSKDFTGKVLAVNADKSGTTELFTGLPKPIAISVASLSAVNNAPSVELNTGITLPEGSVATITNTELNAIDPDTASDSIEYTLTGTFPTEGELWLKDANLNDLREITAAAPTFTQSDIDGGLVEYRHQGSENAFDQFQFTVSDGTSPVSLEKWFDINITATNDAPALVSLESAAINYTENSSVSLTSNLAVTDSDDTDLESAVIKITNSYKIGEDFLTFTDTTNITGSWNAGSGELTLSGTDSLADYESAIKSINYTNSSDNPDTSQRSFSIVVDDGELDSTAQSRNLSISASNDPPEISSIETTVLGYTDGDGKVTVSNALVLSDPDNTTLTSAVVQITAGFKNTEDLLAVTSIGSITSSWNSTTGTLTLSSTGPESVATYQSALRSVTYENTSSVPDTSPRTVAFIVNDGAVDSNSTSRNITISTTNSDPVITTSGSVTYFENNTLEPIAPTATISDPDSPNLDGGILQISLTTGSTSLDRLAILRDGNGTGQVNVSGSGVFYEGIQHGTITNGITGQQPLAITLNALATSQSVEAILRNVSYLNLSNSPVATVDFEVSLTDGDGGSTTVTDTITITARNDKPLIPGLDGTSILAVNDGTFYTLNVSSSGPITDVDSPVDFDGGNITVTKSGFGSGDTLSIDTTGTVNLSAGFVNNSSVSVSGIIIGTLKDITPASFTIEFNNSAIPTRVDELVSAIHFSSTDTNFGLRAIDLSLTDGDGTANGGSDTSISKINVYLNQSTPQVISLTEDIPHIFDASDFAFTGTVGAQLESITITTLPANGVLKLGVNNVALNDQISKAQVDAGSLTFEPTADTNGNSYAFFDFYVNSGNKTVPILAGNSSSYTLDTFQQAAAEILGNASNFGPGGIISTDVSIQNSAATVDAAYLSKGKVLFSGYLPDGSLDATELAAIDTWVRSGGVLISTGDRSTHDDLNSYYGLSISNGGSYYWNVDNTSNSIIDGPFGLVSDFYGSGNGGFFKEADILPGDIVLARDSSNSKATMLLRDHEDGHILFTSDEGIFRTDMTGDGTISTPNDILTANVYAWAVDSAMPSIFHSTIFDVIPENDTSVITLPDSPTYLENASPEFIMPSATVVDIDSFNLDTGTIDVTLTTSVTGSDRLLISDTSDISSDAITGIIDYNGTAVGTVNGGENGLPLVIHLNNNADTTSAQAILRSISFESTTDNPGTSRSFDIDFADGDGGTTTQSGTISIVPINDGPLFHNLDGDLVTALNDSSNYRIDNSILSNLEDKDNPVDLNGATLTVTGSAFDSNDNLGIDTSGNISLSGGLTAGSQISVSGLIIGSISTASNSDLKFSFSANSTIANVSELIQSISYQSTSAITGLRQVTFLLDDGNGIANGGENHATSISNIYLADQPTGNFTTPEDTNYTLTAADFSFTGINYSTVSSITVSTLPTTGTMLLANIPQSTPFTVTKTQLDIGDLKFQPDPDDTGTNYTTFDFYVNNGNPVVNLLPGKTTTDTINGGGLQELDDILTDSSVFNLSTGTVKQDNSIKDSTATITSAYLADGQVLFDGHNENTNYTSSELNAIDGWVRSGGILVSINDDSNHDSLAAFYSLNTIQGTGTDWFIKDTGNPLINGPFGLAGNLGDGLATSGFLSYFNPAALVATDLIVAVDVNDNPVAIVRAIDDGFVLFTSDKDIFQTNLSGNGSIVTPNDIFASNTFAWAFDSAPPNSFKTISIDVSPVNDDPMNSGSLPSTTTVTEDSASQVDLSLISLNDIDSLATDTLKLRLVAGSDGILSASPASGISITGNTSSALEISGTLTDLNLFLDNAANISYLHAVGDTNGVGADSISIYINDNGHSGLGGGNDVLLGITTINISAVNDDPSNSGSLPTDFSVTEDTNSSLDLSSVVIADKDDDGTSIITATLQTSNGGTISANSISGILIDGSSTMVNLHGTQGNLNLYFSNTSNLSYLHPITHFNGNNADTITLTVTDNGNFGTGGGANIDFGTANVHIAEINDDPDNTGSLPLDISGIEDTNTFVDLSLISLSDVDDQGSLLTLNISSSTGGYLFANAGTGITVNGSSTPSLFLDGSLTDLNNYLNNSTNVTYAHPTPHLNGTPADTLNLTVNDNGNTGPGGGTDISIGSVDVTISAVNDDPLNTGVLPGAIVVTEDSASPVDLSLIELSDVDDFNSPVTVTLNTASGSQLVANSSAGVTSTTVGSSLTLTGAITDLNTYFDTPANISYLHDNTNINGNNIDTLSISVNDNGNSGSGGGLNNNLDNIPIDINPVNDAPTLLTDSSDLEYTENDGNVAVSENLILSDIDTNNLDGATVSITANYSASEDSLDFIDNTVISGSWDAIIGTLTLTGTATIPDYQAALSSVSYLNSSESPATLQRTVTFKLTDGADTVAADRNINVTAVNDIPITTALEPTPLNYTENDGAIEITNAIVLGDPDNAQLESATIAIGSGYDINEEKLAFNDTSNISGIWDQANGTLILTGTDTIANYQSAIRSITYQNSSEHPATDASTLNITVNDGQDDSVIAARAIETTRLNDAPDIGSATLSSINEDENSPTAHQLENILGSLFSDLDSTDTLSGVAIISNNATTEGAWEYSTDSSNWYAIGSASDTEALLLDTSTSIRFKPAPDYEGTPPALSLRAIDSSQSQSYTSDGTRITAGTQLNGGTTPFSASISTLTTNVTAINDAPVLSTNARLPDIMEDSATAGKSVGDIITGKFSDVDAFSAFTGIAITTAPTSDGSWQYSLNGSEWLAINSVTDSSALALDTSALIRFLPAANFNGSPAPLLIHAMDDTYTDPFTSTSLERFVDAQVTGDTSSFSDMTRIAVNVIPVNDPPDSTDVQIAPTPEDNQTPIGIKISDLFVADYSDIDGNQKGLAIHMNSATTEGTWQHITNGGDWTDIGTVDIQNALLLSDNDSLRFLPGVHFNGTPPALYGRVIDDTFTGSFSTATTQTTANLSSLNSDSAIGVTDTKISTQVLAVNDPPIGTDGVVTQTEDQPYQFQIIDFGFSDPIENHSFNHIAVKSLPTAGTLTLNDFVVTENQLISVSLVNAGLLKYTAPPNASGNSFAQWDFAVADAGGTTNLGQNTALASNTITINIIAVNDAPAGQDNILNTLEDAPLIFNTADFGFSDVIESDSLHAISITSIPATGILSLDNIPLTGVTTALASDIATGKLIWTPGTDHHGTPHTDFKFKVIDNGGTANGGTDTALIENTITINVDSVNDAPSGQDNILFALEDINYVFNAADFGFSDNQDSDFLKAVIIDSLPGAGSVTLFGGAVNDNDQISIEDINAGGLTFLSAPSSNGLNYAQIDFKVVDNGGTDFGGKDTSLAESTLTFHVLAINDEPSGLDNTITAIEDTPYTLLAEDFSFSDALDGHTLSRVMIVSTPATGDLSASGNPVVPGQVIHIGAIENGALKYTPAPSINGPAISTFDFRVIDSGGISNGGIDTASSEATINIDITAVNDPPTGSSTTVTATEDSTHVLTSEVFGFSDTDIGDTLSAVIIDNISGNGSLTAAGVVVSPGQTIDHTVIDAGGLVFEPLANTHGLNDTTVDFRVVDSGDTDSGLNTAVQAATIVIDVTPVNDPPSSITISNIEFAENTEAAIVGEISITDNDTDDTHSLSVDDARFEIIDGQLSVKPGVVIDFETEPQIPLTITTLDSEGEPYSQLINLLIEDLNDSPLSQGTPEIQSAIPPFSFALPTQMFIDPDGDQLTYSATLENGDPLPAWLEFDPNTQEFTVSTPTTPTSTVNVQVTANDGSGLSATSTIQLILEPEFAPALPAEPTVVIEAPETEPEPEPETKATEDEKEDTSQIADKAVLPEKQQAPEGAEADAELPKPLEIPQPKYTALDIEIIQTTKHVPVVRATEALFIEINATGQQQQTRENLISEVALNKLANQMDDSKQLLRESATEQTKVLGTSVTVASSLSVGYIFWILRSGTLLASILTSLPAWKYIDPLPVLDSLTGDDDESDQETLESMVNENSDADDSQNEKEKKAA